MKKLLTLQKGNRVFLVLIIYILSRIFGDQIEYFEQTFDDDFIWN